MVRCLKAALLFALVALAASPALAGKEDPTWNPPARFDRPYTGPKRVRHLAPEEVYRECARMLKEANGSERGTYPGMRGCQTMDNGFCDIVVPDRVWKKATPEAILRHEYGHCNGWPFEHPD